MFKKIYILSVLVIFIANSMNYTFATMVQANVGDIDFKITSTKQRIKELENGSRYIIKLNKISQFINKQTDINVLRKIKLKLEEKKQGLEEKDELTYQIMSYIGLLVEKRILTLEEIEGINIAKEVENSVLNEDEAKKVEDEIVKIQLNLLDSTNTFVNNLIKDLKKSLNVEKTGNFKLTVEGASPLAGSGKGELSITDMKSKTSNFDSEFEAQVELLVDASLAGGQELKTQFSSFVNFISKDGNMYFLLQKLKYSGLENIDYSGNYTNLLDRLKELGEKNTYLKIEDKQSQKTLEMIKNFDLNNVYNEANKVLSKPMLKPYKKDGNKYLLVPTKDFCDTIKYIDYKFNNHGSSSCSNEEYNKMLKLAVSGGSIYIIIDGTDKHFGMESNQYGEKGILKIFYTDNKIEKLLFNLDITAGRNKGDKVEFAFINGQKLDFIVLSNNNEKLNFSFKSLLTTSNEFSKIDHMCNFSKNGEGFNSYFKLENKIFNGKYELVGYKDISFLGKISGSLNSTNSLSNLDLSINALSETEEYNYDWNTGDSKYTPVKTIFDLNYSLKNELITGTISYKENDVEMFNLISNGKYRKGYFELNNKAKIINDYNNEEINGNLNAKYTGNLSDNTFDLYIDVNSNEGNIKINLKTDSKLQYKDDIKIETPTNTKDINDLMGGNNYEVQDSPEAEVPEFFE